MSTHKVPQNVETDDKLIGFLSLKQFIFVLIGLGFGWLTFFFFTKIHPLAALLFVPPTIVALVLGLYQRQDQPVEVFLASALRFYLKPRKRIWDQEGYEERVKITAPPKIEHHYTKGFTGAEAVGRLSNLSRMMDSRGWASKMTADWQNPQMLAAATSEDRLVSTRDVASAQGFNPQQYMTPVDVMDDSSSILSQQFANRIAQADSSARQQAFQTMQQARQAQGPQSTPTAPVTQDTPVGTPRMQPYPAMHQRVMAPAMDQAPTQATPSDARNVAPPPIVAKAAQEFVQERPIESQAQRSTSPDPETIQEEFEISLH